MRESLIAFLLGGVVLCSPPAFAQFGFQPAGTGNGANTSGTNTVNPTFLQNITGSILSYSGSTLSLQSGKTLDLSAGTTTLPGSGQIAPTTGFLGLGVTPGSWLDVGASLSSAPASVTTGVLGRFRGVTHTDTAGSGAVTGRVGWSFGAPTFDSTSVLTDGYAATVYIGGPPVAAGNTSITASSAMLIANGSVGIGTTAPQATLEVSTTANGGQFRVTSNQNNSSITLNNTQAGGTLYEISSTGGSASVASALRLGKTGGITNIMVNSTGDVGIGGLISNNTPAAATLVAKASGFVGIGTGSPAAQLQLAGNISAAAWTTNGIKLRGGGSTLTDTSSSGTVAAAYTSALGGNTIAASNATTFTNYYGLFVAAPTAGTNVTMTNKYAFGADSINSPQYYGAGVAGVDCTGITAGTVTVSKGIVTHC